MSDPTPTFGDINDNNDLQQGSTTDALKDADALDALLNEIASRKGFPGTRHHEPNTRTDDGASVLETAAAFHRQVDTAQGRDARATGPDPHLWETIMERSGASQAHAAATTTANPSVARQKPTRTRTPQLKTRRSKSRSARRIARAHPFWNMAATVGLVLTIVVAGFGVWRLSGTPGLPGSGGGSSPGPAANFAMLPATPGSAAADTGATPTPVTGCDLSHDIPIFNGNDTSLWSGTAVYLKTSGEVVLTCQEESKGTVLATTTGRASVIPVGWSQAWPGAVMIHDDNSDTEQPRLRIVSLMTGDTVEFGVVISESQSAGVQHASGSPWVVGPAPGDTADVQILDLRTMHTRLLSEIAGMPLPQHGGYLQSSSDDGRTLALALIRQAYPSPEQAPLVTTDLPGDLLVLDGSLDAATWITGPQGFPPVVDIAVSPDGNHLALHGASGKMEERKHTWSIVSLDDGTIVANSTTFEAGPEPIEGLWTDNGVVYIDGSELMLLSLDGNLSEEAMFQGEGRLTDLQSTSDDDIVLVNQMWTDDLATMVANAQTPTFHAVNLSTGETTTFTGVDVSRNMSPWPYPTRFLVTFDYQVEPRQAVTYQVLDVVAGETVGTLEDVPLDNSGYEGYPMLGPRSVVSSADGETEVIAFDTQHIYLMQVADGEPTVRQIAPPEGLPSTYPLMAQMFLSPDGSLLSLTAEGDEARTRWLLPLDGEPDEWTTVENQTVGSDPGYIFFVPGTSD